MNRIKSFFKSIILLLVLCLPLKGVAQSVETLSDSLVYSMKMYQDLYNKYKSEKDKKQKDVIEFVKHQFRIDSEVNLNTKFDAIGRDSIDVAALAKTFSNKYGVSVSDDDIVGLSTVSDLSDVVCKKDSNNLMLVYYPWKTIFDTHSVYRVGLYHDGINILKDLIGYTCDSIQREIYINELMHVYDVWYEYADTINASINETFSKTMIKSDKVRDYIEMYPGEINEDNVMHPHYVRMYDFIIEALSELDNQEDIYYLNVDKLMRISVQRLKKNWKKYRDQYAADFDLLDARMRLLLDHVTREEAKGNITMLRNEHAKVYKANEKKMIEEDERSNKPRPIVVDCDASEETYAEQMWEKSMDYMFLDEVIRKLRYCPNSDVYIEALENYTYLTNVDPAEIIDKRFLLLNEYIKRERYDEAIAQIDFLLGLNDVDAIEKSHLWFRWGVILERQGNVQQAAFRYKNALKLNKKHGDAYFRLALMYAKNKYKLGDDEKNLFIDRYKYLLCIDKLELAKKNIQEYANSDDYGKYNKTEISVINQQIAYCKGQCPGQAMAFMLGLDTGYQKIGASFTFKGGVMNGETTTIRFY